MADADLTERINAYKLGLKAAAKVKSLEKTRLRMKKYREAQKAKLGTKLYNHQHNVQVLKSIARKKKIATVEAEEKKEAIDRAVLLQKSDGERRITRTQAGTLANKTKVLEQGDACDLEVVHEPGIPGHGVRALKDFGARRNEARNDGVDARWGADVERGMQPVGSMPPPHAYHGQRGPRVDDRPRNRRLADLGQQLGVTVDVGQYNTFAAEYCAQHPGSTWMQTKRVYLEGRVLALAGGVPTEELRAEVSERVEEAMYGPELPVPAPVGMAELPVHAAVGMVGVQPPEPPGGGAPAVLVRSGTYPV